VKVPQGKAGASVIKDIPDIRDVSDIRDIPDVPDIPDIPDVPDISGGLVITTTHQVRPSKPSSPATVSSIAATPVKPSPMVLGIDTLVASGATILNNARSKTYLNQAPEFWGRYVYAPGQQNSLGKQDSHYSQAENALLRAQGIRLLPIARQTNHVNQAAKAKTDAVNNVAAIFEVFPPQYLSGADPDVLVFLDVERDNPMTETYYSDWSSTIISEAASRSNSRVRFHPAIYASQGDAATWTALRKAMDGGAVCDGAWVARYYHPTPRPMPWNDHLTTPAASLVCPILCWQYWASPDDAPSNSNFDTNLASPSHADTLLNRLIMPSV
jgi:hypothetical protein